MGKIKGEPFLLPEMISAYYGSSSIDLSALSNVNFRHFRFRLEDGSFYKVPRKIRVWNDLKKQILKTLPLDVYYSSACWLNPHKIGSRTEGNVLKNLLISCDLVFDIDVNGTEIKNFEGARKQAILLKNYLISNKIEVRYLAFSGSKGFHVVSNDPWVDEKRFEDPAKREKYAIEKRRQFAKEAKAQGLFFDEKVTVDTRRIIRLPGSINSKTGLACTVLSDDQAKLGIEKIFKLATTNGIITPRIPSLRGDDQGLRPAQSLRKGGRLGVRPILDTHYFSTFMTNNVPLTQLKVPILEIGKWKGINAACRIIGEIQQRYGIGDAFLFDDQDRWIAFSIKTVARRRLEKMLFNAESLNLNACRKFGCTYFRVGSSVGLDGRIIQPAPKFIKVLESDLHGQISRPHFELLDSMGIKVKTNGQKMCGPGKEKLELVHCVME